MKQNYLICRTMIDRIKCGIAENNQSIAKLKELLPTNEQLKLNREKVIAELEQQNLAGEQLIARIELVSGQSIH